MGTGRESFSPCLDSASLQREKYCLWNPEDLGSNASFTAHHLYELVLATEKGRQDAFLLECGDSEVRDPVSAS